jgi:nitrogen regulatory protein P-II 1
MVKLTAIMKPFRLEQVLQALPTQGLWEVLLSEIRGYGRQKGHLERYAGREYEAPFVPKVRMEVYCEDEVMGEVERAMVEKARTGLIGDGKVFLSRIEGFEPI